MPPRFSLNTDLTLGVNAPLGTYIEEQTGSLSLWNRNGSNLFIRTRWDPHRGGCHPPAHHPLDAPCDSVVDEPQLS
jgi:hypothetical protein